METEVNVHNKAKNCTREVQSNTMTSVRSNAPSDHGLCHPVKSLACRLIAYPQLTEQLRTLPILLNLSAQFRILLNDGIPAYLLNKTHA